MLLKKRLNELINGKSSPNYLLKIDIRNVKSRHWAALIIVTILGKAGIRIDSKQYTM